MLALAIDDARTFYWERPAGALAAIAEHRLRLHDLEVPIDHLISSDALDALVGFYNEANRSLRLTLAALRTGSPPRPVPTIG